MADELCYFSCLDLRSSPLRQVHLPSVVNQALEEKVTFNVGKSMELQRALCKKCGSQEGVIPTPLLMKRGPDAMCLVFERRLNHVLYLAGTRRRGGEPG